MFCLAFLLSSLFLINFNLSIKLVNLLQQFQYIKMSASLPRIKTISQMASQPPIDALQKLKFRKLNLQTAQNGEERKPSLKVLKTQRLKSLQRYSTTQQQREYKNEKIHLNLIERKLLNGTYDEKKETSNELNTLKHKRDSIKVETALKQREMERIKELLNDVKKQIEIFNSKKGQHDIKLKQIKDKHELQIQKTETARQTKGVFENMIKIRHEINMVLCKRTNELKQQVGFLNSALTLIDTELRETTQKCAIQETKLEQLLQITAKEREDRNLHIGKHQGKIEKRKEGEVLQAVKSKQYIALLDQVERKQQMKEFKAIYDKILANLFVSRYCKKVILDLTAKYEPYEHSYSLISSYQTFDRSNPKTLVTRYLQQQPQKIKNMLVIQQKEKHLATLQAKNQALKQKELEVVNEEMMNQQNLLKINKSGLMTNEKSQISIVKDATKSLEQKTLQIKTSILRMLKDLKQKGDRRLNNGYQPTVNNLTLLSKIVMQLIKE